MNVTYFWTKHNTMFYLKVEFKGQLKMLYLKVEFKIISQETVKNNSQWDTTQDKSICQTMERPSSNINAPSIFHCKNWKYISISYEMHVQEAQLIKNDNR